MVLGASSPKTIFCIIMRYLPILSLILFLCSCENSHEQEWLMIWSDEFEQTGQPDDTKWSFSGRKSPDWACYCTDSPANAFVADGYLHLMGTGDKQPDGTMQYHTGCLHSKGKFSFLYGKVEVRAKLSQGKGSWPAIWMMPEQNVYGGWPRSGEIDIMEHLNYDNRVYQTIHTEFLDNQGGKERVKYYVTAPYDVKDFNVFGCEWYPDSLVFSINGEKTFSYPKQQENTPEKWPFDQSFYIILNQALGGNWVGDIDPEDLPQEMQVDWVRVYQLSASK